MTKEQPTFPSIEIVHHEDGLSQFSHVGLSIRQYYAAKAMQAIFINPGLLLTPRDNEHISKGELTAINAFAMADALIAFEEEDK